MAFSKGGKTRGGSASLPHRRNMNQSEHSKNPNVFTRGDKEAKLSPRVTGIPAEKIHRLKTKPKNPFSPITGHGDKKASQLWRKKVE